MDLIKKYNNSSLENVKELIISKKYYFSKNELGLTPLHIVAFEGYPDICKLLIENGANPLEKDNYGLTPLHKASYRGSVHIVKILLDYNNININEKSDYGDTPLIYTCHWNHLEIVKILLEHGANVNLKNKNEITALYKAASRNNIEIMKILISSGSTVNNVSNFGFTEFHFIKNNNEIVNLILKKGLSIHINDIIDTNDIKSNRKLLLYYLFPYIFKKKNILRKIPIDLLYFLSDF